MGGGASLLPEPSERTLKCIQKLSLTNKELAAAFSIFQARDVARKGTIPLGIFYKMLNEKKSVFVDSIFELLGVRDNQEIDFGEWYATTHSRSKIFIFRVIASHEIRAEFTPAH
jgi:hypothetical protein